MAHVSTVQELDTIQDLEDVGTQETFLELVELRDQASQRPSWLKLSNDITTCGENFYFMVVD